MKNPAKERAPQNRTLSLSKNETNQLQNKLIRLSSNVSVVKILNRVINQDLFDAIKFLPENFVDLLFIDPPYNLSKKFDELNFRKMKEHHYEEWMDSWLSGLKKILKKTSSIYFCSDWRSSIIAGKVLSKHFIIKNRITWEREKGRGAQYNWKNSSEDIWFCTVSEKFTFNVNDVKVRRNVLAPYKQNGQPKDWNEQKGSKFRDTHPSNLWTDITVPFWSMPENTNHPTQKPEKLLAKIILASSNKNDFIFDPFLGSGTTAVVSKKLDRNFSGIEVNKDFCCLALKRLQIADEDKSIQGFEDGVFWERNSLKSRKY